MLLSTKALLDKNPKHTEEEIRTAIAGNLCGAPSMSKMVEAIEAIVEGKV